MGRFYFRSARVAAWVACALLAVMASYFFQPVSANVHYTRVWQFYHLAWYIAVAVAILQPLRAGFASLEGRFRKPDGRAPADSLTFQLWGPLMLENLVYGALILVALAFVWRHQQRLPVGEAWQGDSPPFPGVKRADLVSAGSLYLSGLLLTVAASYGRLLRVGLLALPMWGAIYVVLPSPLPAAFVVLALLRLAAGLPLPEPREVRRPSWGALLVVAVCVLGWVLVSPNFIRSHHGGQTTACKSNLKNIGMALEMYSTDYAGLYPTSPGLLTPNYLKTIPTCPSTGWVTYQFQLSSHPDLYTVVCDGANHRAAGIEGNYPQYTSFMGLIERP